MHVNAHIPIAQYEYRKARLLSLGARVSSLVNDRSTIGQPGEPGTGDAERMPKPETGSAANGASQTEETLPEKTPGTNNGANEAASPARSEAVREFCERQFVEAMNNLISADERAKASPQVVNDAGPLRLLRRWLQHPAKNDDILARLIIISRLLPESDMGYEVYREATYASNLLKTPGYDATEVRQVLDDIEFHVCRSSPLSAVMKGLLTAVVASLLAVILAIIVWLALVAKTDSSFEFVILYNWLLHKLVVAAFFGMLGSAVSIMLRLADYEARPRRTREFLYLTGLLLPVVGIAFACVTCALFNSGIVTFPLASGKTLDNPYFYVVIGFLSGFSERFTRNLLSTTETALSATESRKPIPNNS